MRNRNSNLSSSVKGFGKQVNGLMRVFRSGAFRSMKRGFSRGYFRGK